MNLLIRSKIVPYEEREHVDKKKLKNLINIYEGNHNEIGEKRTSLSKNSYSKMKAEDYKNISNKARNVLHHKFDGRASNTIWTCFKVFYDSKKIKVKDYTTCFTSVNERATNKYSERTNLAYLVNRFLNPMVKKFYQKYGIDIDEDTWALSELIQWIWRSAIRDGKPINLFIPSIRMRKLFIEYLNEEDFENAPELAITNSYPSDWNL